MRTYRVGGTMGPLLAWNIFTLGALYCLFASAPEERLEDRRVLYSIAGVVILLGPAAFLAYLIRYRMVRVEVGDAGLTLSGRREIPWSDVKGVRLRGWRPRPWNPFRSVEMSGCSWILVIFLFKIIILALVLLVLLWILRATLLPVAVLYSPWHSRVVIDLVDGSRLVYRDLSDAEDFVRSVQGHLRDRAEDPEV